MESKELKKFKKFVELGQELKSLTMSPEDVVKFICSNYTPKEIQKIKELL